MSFLIAVVDVAFVDDPFVSDTTTLSVPSGFDDVDVADSIMLRFGKFKMS